MIVLNSYVELTVFGDVNNEGSGGRNIMEPFPVGQIVCNNVGST